MAVETPLKYSAFWAGEERRGHMSKVEEYIISIPDYPKPGIIFRDITSVLRDADGLRLAVDEMTQRIGDVQFDAIVGLESRGFLFGMPMAYNLHKAFIPIRKRGKLPRETAHISYDLEYGSAEIEVHKEDITPGMRVVVVDDLIATGGTLEAAIKLLEGLGAKVVKVVCLLELKGLHGRDRLAGYPTETVIAYEGK